MDHYATVTYHNAPEGRVVAQGWMSNWLYANNLPTLPFRSQNTIARDLSLYTDENGEYRVAVKPSPEYDALRGEIVEQPTEACVIDVRRTKDDGPMIVTLSNDKGEKVVMTLDLRKRTFSMDRRHAGDCSFSKDFATVTTAPLCKCKNEKITLFIDRCSIEAFDGEGAWAMTDLVFPSEPYNHIDVQGGEATVYNLKI
jgi:levanase/fructan beta-fructosidase